MDSRPYQDEQHDAVYAAWMDFQRVLLVASTGTGKTICFARVAAREVEMGNRALILAHRDELIRQAQDKIGRATGLATAIEKAKETSIGSPHMITVGSVQTMMSTKRLSQFKPNHFAVIIIDESHRCLAASYQKILKHFPNARVLGVTATPDRGDKKSLGHYFETVAHEYGLRRAISEGYLCKITAQTIPLKIDISAVKQRGDDFADDQLGAALEPYLPLIAESILKYCATRKTLIFVPLCATGRKLRDALTAAGMTTFYADGEYRDEITNFEAHGPGCALINAMLLTEGYDHPPIDCVIPLRCTKVRALFCQQVGRGTRIHPGKQDLLILDFLWNTATHDLCHPADIIAETPEVARAMKSIQDASGKQMELTELEAKAHTDVAAQREKALADALKAQEGKKAKLHDLMAYALSVHDEALQEYEAVFDWQKGPASPAQLEAIEKFGFKPGNIPNRGYATMLLDRLITRSKSDLARPKQIALLQKYGYTDAGDVTFAEATRRITAIKNNGWIRPYDRILTEATA